MRSADKDAQTGQSESAVIDIVEDGGRIKKERRTSSEEEDGGGGGAGGESSASPGRPSSRQVNITILENQIHALTAGRVLVLFAYSLFVFRASL